MNKILIVEDDLMQGNMLFHTITNKYPDWDLVICDNYQSALRLIKNSSSHPFTLFLLDIRLEINPCDRSGFLLSEVIREMPYYYKTPILFLTSILDEHLHALSNFHCYNYITKPYTSQDILYQIEQLLITGYMKEYYISIIDTNRVRLRLEIESILYVKSSGHTLLLFTKYGTVKTRTYSLQSFLQHISSTFIQCHRQYAIQKSKVIAYDAINQTLTISCSNKPLLIPVGRAYRATIKNLFFSTS